MRHTGRQNDCDSELIERYTVLEGRFSPLLRIPAGSKYTALLVHLLHKKKHLVPLNASHPLTHSNFVSLSPTSNWLRCLR